MKKQIGRWVFGFIFLIAVFMLGYFFGSSRPASTASLIIQEVPAEKETLPVHQWLPSHYGPAYRLDLNSATAEELQKLPGVGEILAQRILEYRKSIVAFRSTEELLEVEGISENLFNEIRHMTKVGGEP